MGLIRITDGNVAVVVSIDAAVIRPRLIDNASHTLIDFGPTSRYS
jgi:hypothetical protein